MDVQVKLPTGECIGIEVTLLSRDRSRRGSRLDAYQASTRKFASECESAYQRFSDTPVYTQLWFSTEFRLHANEASEWAERIARFVADIARHGRSLHELIAPSKSLPLGIQRLVINPAIHPVQPQFAPSYAGSHEDLTPEHIDGILRQKEPRLPSYRQKCQTVWLLVVLDTRRMSGWLDIETEATCRTYETSFDRVLLLDNGSKVKEISTRRLTALTS